MSDIIGNVNSVRIIDALAKGPISVNDIVRITGIEQTNVSHNLRFLLDRKLVGCRIMGRRHEYYIKNEIKQVLLKLVVDIRKNEELLSKGGLIAFLVYAILKYPLTGQLPAYSSIFIANHILTSLKSMYFAV